MNELLSKLNRMTTLAEEREALLATLHTGIIEALPDGLVVIDEDGHIALVNSQAEMMFGYHRSEMVGQSVEMLMPEQHREVHVRHREGYIQEPKLRAMGAGAQLLGRRKNGREFPVSIMLSPLPPTTKGVFVIALLRRAHELR